MAFFRQYIVPLLIVLVFTLALVAVSARIFLPDDMIAPAPISEDIETIDGDGVSVLDGPEIVAIAQS